MTKSASKICRICLEQLGENVHFYFLNNNNGSMLLSMLLDFLPEIDLDFVQNPISCNRCTNTIERIHEFKKLCMPTENVLKQQRKSFNDVKNETEIETIKEEFLEDKYTINMPESVQKMCRICREQLGENEHFQLLDNDDGSMLLSKLLDFLPEIDLNFVQNGISCSRCTITIDRIHKFKKLCVQTESVIKDLKMQQKSFDDVRSHVKKDTEIVTIKEEVKDEPLTVDNSCMQFNLDLAVCMEVPTKQLFYCYTCDYTTYNKKNLKRHVKVHRLQDRRFKCDQCSHTALTNSSLTAHKRSHLNIRPYRCNICDYSFVQKSNLKAHIRSHTTEKPYKCNLCNYCCSRKSNLINHIRTHTGEKPYKCDLCDYSCVRKNTLKVHLISHTGEKPYNCTKCDFRCSYKQHLKSHIHTHSGEKPYKCDVCHRCFSRNWYLIGHMRTHTGEKPYKCDICDYRCNLKCRLKEHIRTHTGEKPYKCDVCDYSCVQKHNLNVHLRSHTGKKSYNCS